ncbi:MAG: hypothetical protein JKY66_10290 [Spongiibacteraceae bacterium]|nr:hypothetical protein [Spongiibacteraceae bacterium]
MQILKPLDVVVGLLIGINEKHLREAAKDGELKSLRTNSVGDLATSLYKGKGDISRSITRLLSLSLIGERRPKEGDALAVNRKFYSLQRTAMSDFLLYGIRHVFAPERLGVGRGEPTGWSCPHITSEMNPPELALVWGMPGGSVHGELLEPLFTKAAQVAGDNSELYTLLALIDVIRTGKPRELVIAKELLAHKIQELYS